MKDDERAFIHDLSSPLMVAIGALDVALGLLEKSEPKNPALIERLNKAHAALDKITTILRARRSEIYKS
jgi:hypothetical protein